MKPNELIGHESEKLGVEYRLGLIIMEALVDSMLSKYQSVKC